MADQRKTARAEAKLRTALAIRAAEDRAGLRYARITATLDTVRSILADSAFIDILRTHGLQSLPRPFAVENASTDETCDALRSSDEALNDRALDFAVAWRFFGPLLNYPSVAAYLDSHRPGFTLELRDVFISLVADGPFPHQPIGRGRRTI
jgi:hypothetical protein